MTDNEIERLAAECIAEDWEPDRYYRELNVIAFARAIFKRECSSDHCEFEKDAERYRLIRSALLSGGPEWAKLAAMLNIAPDTAEGVDDAVDATFLMEANDGTR